MDKCKCIESQLTHPLCMSSGICKPFLWPSLFNFTPPSIKFYVKGARVKKPPSEFVESLNWCQNSLIPVVIRQSLIASHFKIVDERQQWIGYWGRHWKSEQFRHIMPYQKVNHFPGAFHMGRKDRLWQNIKKLAEDEEDCVDSHNAGAKSSHSYVTSCCVMPMTYLLPKESRRLQAYMSQNIRARAHASSVRKYIILKPPASARGTGIRIVSRWSEIPRKVPLIAQHYIETPLIINGSKFDLRFYVYVTSLDPLRIYIYNEGLVRFASVAYSNSFSSFSNQFMHLTNYSINKLAIENGCTSDPVPKWKLSDFWHYLRKRGLDADLLRVKIEEIAIKAVIACESNIRQHWNNLEATSSNPIFPFTCHELFGMDVLVDSALRPWLVEMNISPSLHSSTRLDFEVKAPLAKDVLNMCSIPFPIHTNESDFLNSIYYRTRPCPQNKSSEHLEKEQKHLGYFESTKNICEDIIESLTDHDLRILVDFEDEFRKRGNFKLIYPIGCSSERYLYQIRPPLLYSNLLMTKWQQVNCDNIQSFSYTPDTSTEIDPSSSASYSTEDDNNQDISVATSSNDCKSNSSEIVTPPRKVRTIDDELTPALMLISKTTSTPLKNIAKNTSSGSSTSSSREENDEENKTSDFEDEEQGPSKTTKRRKRRQRIGITILKPYCNRHAHIVPRRPLDGSLLSKSSPL